MTAKKKEKEQFQFYGFRMPKELHKKMKVKMITEGNSAQKWILMLIEKELEKDKE
jgi:hypothetical protein